jgi:hypothetical protein
MPTKRAKGGRQVERPPVGEEGEQGVIDPLRPSRRHLLYTAGPIRPNSAGSTKQHIAVAVMVTEALRRAGWGVVCPHKNSWDIEGLEVEDYLSEDFEIILRADAVVLLPNWRESDGARREVEFASLRGIDVIDWRRLVPVPYVIPGAKED